MTTASTTKEAIGRSISHNEIVLVITTDPREALANIDTDENVTALDHAVENNGDLDVWGTRLGDDFRIRIRDDRALGSRPFCPSLRRGAAGRDHCASRPGRFPDY